MRGYSIFDRSHRRLREGVVHAAMSDVAVEDAGGGVYFEGVEGQGVNAQRHGLPIVEMERC